MKDISIFDVQRNFEGKVKKNEGNQILGKSLGLALILIFAIFAEGSQYYKWIQYNKNVILTIQHICAGRWG